MSDDDMRACDDCGREFPFWSFPALVARDPNDESCSPFTDLVRYCKDCWPKHSERYTK